jgi:hypothetical protein
MPLSKPEWKTSSPTGVQDRKGEVDDVAIRESTRPATFRYKASASAALSSRLGSQSKLQLAFFCWQHSSEE